MLISSYLASDHPPVHDQASIAPRTYAATTDDDDPRAPAVHNGGGGLLLCPFEFEKMTIQFQAAVGMATDRLRRLRRRLPSRQWPSFSCRWCQ